MALCDDVLRDLPTAEIEWGSTQVLAVCQTTRAEMRVPDLTSQVHPGPVRQTYPEYPALVLATRTTGFRPVQPGQITLVILRR
ncbi:hypothetical protein M747DRAFT_299617 [Aspergillus niger ATCC 13496]|uniref:Uncharacterized protein n=1 Tax=Aspergillus niger ATCC 13496 TaxID=1353008 RepID=A0A370BPJ8_ASPNG|nr:hypothetical protein M747DRAFT_299617 [Aspergillus niger ATCC 13496]